MFRDCIFCAVYLPPKTLFKIYLRGHTKGLHKEDQHCNVGLTESVKFLVSAYKAFFSAQLRSTKLSNIIKVIESSYVSNFKTCHP